MAKKHLVFLLPGSKLKAVVQELSSAYRRERHRLSAEGRFDQKGRRGFVVIEIDRDLLERRDIMSTDPRERDSIPNIIKKFGGKQFMSSHDMAYRAIQRLEKAEPPYFKPGIVASVREIATLAVTLHRVFRAAAWSPSDEEEEKKDPRFVKQFMRDMDRSFKDAINQSFKAWANEPFDIPWINSKGHRTTISVKLKDFLRNTGQYNDYERLIENVATTMMQAAKKHIGQMTQGWQAHLDPGRDRSFIEDVVMETVASLLGGQQSIWDKAKKAAYKAMDEAVKYALHGKGSRPSGPGVDSKAADDLKKGVNMAVEQARLDEAEESKKLALAGLRKAIRRFAEQQVGKPKRDETPQDLWDRVEPLTDPKVLHQFLYQIHEFKVASKKEWDIVVGRAADVLAEIFSGVFKKLRVGGDEGISREAWATANSRARARLGRLFSGKAKTLPKPLQILLGSMSPVINTRKAALEKVFQSTDAAHLNNQLSEVFNFAFYLGATIKNRTSNAIRKLQQVFSFKEGTERAYTTEDEGGDNINVIQMFEAAVRDADAEIDLIDWMKRGQEIDAGGRKAKIIPFVEWLQTTSPKAKKRMNRLQYKFVLRYLELLMGDNLGSGIKMPREPVPDRQIVNYLDKVEGGEFGDKGRSTLFRWAKDVMPKIVKEYDDWRKGMRLELVSERRDYWQNKLVEADKQISRGKRTGNSNAVARGEALRKEAEKHMDIANNVIDRIRRSGSEINRLILAGGLILHALQTEVTPRTMIASKKERYGGTSPVALQVERVLRSVFRGAA